MLDSRAILLTQWSHITSAWLPPDDLSLSEWAARHFVLSEEAASEPGAWHAYPYQIGIMDAITDPEIEFITWMKSARVGYTKILNAATAYYIAHDPSAILIVQPTVEDAQGHSKDEIAPMIRDMPILRELVAEAKSRDSGNTILHKTYPGGSMHLIGANSPRGFRRLTKRIVLFDEVDGYPITAGQSGDQIRLGIRRTQNAHARKIVMGSTPLLAGVSRIERQYERSDQRIFKVPCPHCGTLQRIMWKGIKWPAHNPHRAYMECTGCGQPIDERDKKPMLEAALAYGNKGWHAQAESPGHAGFHISALYSLAENARWGQIATEFLEVKDKPEELMTFTNEALGETWEVDADRVDSQEVFRTKRSHYTEAPADALVITAGIDCQKDRIEAEIVIWAEDMQSWSLKYERRFGDPGDQEWLDETLDDLLGQTFKHESGHELHITAACIDSAGLNTTEVYKYCKPRWRDRRYAIRGQGGQGLPVIVSSSRSNKYKVRLFNIGVDGLKVRLFQRLTIATPGPGYCNFPTHYGEDYFAGLASERAIIKYSRGQKQMMFTHDTGVPNEPLDCRIYAMAALEIAKPQWDRIAAALQPTDDTEDQPEQKRQPRRTRKRGRRFASSHRP